MMDKRTFISKTYSQACIDFLERYGLDSINYASLTDKERLTAIINIVKDFEIEEIDFFSFWYLI